MGAVSVGMPHHGKEELGHSHSSLGVLTARTSVNAGTGVNKGKEKVVY